ncbi:MAG: hypothetical protein AAGM67_13200, partial [Bacteroidota bacterium]
LIRALALRVMTSIRVPDIIQIQLLAVQKCASDYSPYVRKCAANAVPKIFMLGADRLPFLKDILIKLLADANTMVLGSAVAAFNEVCPKDMAVLHGSFRKLCSFLADCDEWAQIMILKTLANYLRNQFVDPNPGEKEARLERARRANDEVIEELLGQGANSLDSSTESASASAQQVGSISDSSISLPPRKKRTVKRRLVKKAFYSDEEDESEEEEVCFLLLF